MSQPSVIRSAPDILERHFTPAELAEAWKLDESTVRRIFQDEVGVLKISTQGVRSRKRAYTTIRVPESVAARVYQERTR
jgi:hypothetical protein